MPRPPGFKQAPHVIASMQTVEARARRSASLKGKPKSPEHCAAIRAARLGKKRSPETIEKMRKAATGKRLPAWFKAYLKKRWTGTGNPQYGKTPTQVGVRGRWQVYKGVMMRSGFEARFARQLDRRGLTWEYEPKRFDLQGWTYLPDFYLPQAGAYVEVKGWMDSDSILRITRFRKLYPTIPLIVVDERVLRRFESREVLL